MHQQGAVVLVLRQAVFPLQQEKEQQFYCFSPALSSQALRGSLLDSLKLPVPQQEQKQNPTQRGLLPAHHNHTFFREFPTQQHQEQQPQLPVLQQEQFFLQQQEPIRKQGAPKLREFLPFLLEQQTLQPAEQENCYQPALYQENSLK